MRKIKKLMVASFMVSGLVLASGCNKQADQVVASEEAAAPAAEPAAAEPAAVVDAATKYDGKIVHQPEAGRGKDDGWFLVKEGKRRWITEATWPDANGYNSSEVIYITSEEFASIPEDPRPLPETAADTAQIAQPAEEGADKN